MEHGYKRMGKEHREIYLNNANRTEKANLKTTLRYKVTDKRKEIKGFQKRRYRPPKREEQFT